MPIAVVCPSCRSRLNAPDGTAGKFLTCPKCSGPVGVPVSKAPPVASVAAVASPVLPSKSPFDFDSQSASEPSPIPDAVDPIEPPSVRGTTQLCPLCRQGFTAPASLAGEIVQCPHCRKDIRLEPGNRSQPERHNGPDGVLIASVVVLILAVFAAIWHVEAGFAATWHMGVSLCLAVVSFTLGKFAYNLARRQKRPRVGANIVICFSGVLIAWSLVWLLLPLMVKGLA